jgi:16S rRNA (uracil1498-N3)-methyltransferase
MTATPAWPPKSAPRLFVEMTLAEGLRLPIEGGQAHYLGKVMRIAPNDAVILCDDRTGEWVARVTQVEKRAVVVEVERQSRPRENVPDFWLCAALLKKPNFDLVLEKATELGVAKVVPVVTRRCVADKLNPERARTIMTEAAEQCARTALPALGETAKLEHMLRDWPDGRTLFFADENGGMPVAKAAMSTRQVSDRNDPSHRIGDSWPSRWLRVKSRRSAGASAPSTRNSSTAPAITTPRPMTSPAASATC